MRWRIAASREVSPKPGEDAARAWAVEVARDSEWSRTRVVLSSTAAAAVSIAPECATAVQTGGQSAVERYLDGETLPRRIVLTPEGIFPEFN